MGLFQITHLKSLILVKYQLNILNEYKEKKRNFPENRRGLVSFYMEKNSVVKGDLHALGNALIDGVFIGNIHIDGMIIISENAVIKGRIFAKRAELYGRVEGDIIIDGEISLYSTAQVDGNIYSRKIVADDCSNVKGLIDIIPYNTSGSDLIAKAKTGRMEENEPPDFDEEHSTNKKYVIRNFWGEGKNK